jgi:hypothetical protein
MISRAMDAPLPFVKSLYLRAHLFFCSQCTRYSNQLRVLRQTLVKYQERRECEGEALSSEVKKIIQEQIDKELTHNRHKSD